MELLLVNLSSLLSRFQAPSHRLSITLILTGWFSHSSRYPPRKQRMKAMTDCGKLVSSIIKPPKPFAPTQGASCRRFLQRRAGHGGQPVAHEQDPGIDVIQPSMPLKLGKCRSDRALMAMVMQSEISLVFR